MVAYFIDVSTEKGLMISGQKALEIVSLIPCRTNVADATLHACVGTFKTPVCFYPLGIFIPGLLKPLAQRRGFLLFADF
jgi:hypothetical protein